MRHSPGAIACCRGGDGRAVGGTATLGKGEWRWTRGGDALPEGWARSHYETAIDRLTDAAVRDQVLAWEERERDLEIGEKMLWATRAENLRYLVYKPSS